MQQSTLVKTLISKEGIETHEENKEMAVNAIFKVSFEATKNKPLKLSFSKICIGQQLQSTRIEHRLFSKDLHVLANSHNKSRARFQKSTNLHRNRSSVQILLILNSRQLDVQSN